MTDAELKRDMSCREIEAQTGVSKSTISRFLNNGHDISLSTARKLLPVLKDCPCCTRADLPPAAVTVKPLPRQHGQKLGWKLPPDLLLEFQQEVTNDGWDTCMEVVEIVALAAERRILSALTPAPVAGWRSVDVPIPADVDKVDIWILGVGRVTNVVHPGAYAGATHWMPLPPAPGTQPATEQPSVQEAARVRSAFYSAMQEHLFVNGMREIEGISTAADAALRSLAQGDE